MTAPSPYRAKTDSRTPDRRRWTEVDRDALAALGVLWLVCLLRVGGGVFRHQTFGAEETLAALGALGVPWLLLRGPARPRGDRSV